MCIRDRVKTSPTLRAFAAHPFIKDVCHDLLGPSVRLYWDQSVYKKTAQMREFPWHQDNGYTFIEPQQYLTFWLPLVDVDAVSYTHLDSGIAVEHERAHVASLSQN